MATTPYGTLGAIIRETLTPRIDYYTKELSPWFKTVFPSSKNVVKADWGRDWLVKKTFRTGLAGAFQFGSMTPGTAYLATGDTAAPNFNIYGESSQSVWQTPNQATSPGFFNWQIGLTKGIGNMYIPAELRRVAATGAAIGDEFSANIDATAENVALNVCNAFFAETHTISGKQVPGILATIATTTGGVFGAGAWASGTAKTAIPILSGSIRRFADGLQVDLWYDNDGTLTKINTGGPVFVNVTDDLADTIGLVNMGSGDSGSSYAITIPTSGTTVYITPHMAYAATSYVLASVQPYPNLPFGIERVLINSGSLYGTAGTGGIDLSRHPVFKSYLINVGASLDEMELMRYIARWQRSRSTLFHPDTFVCSEGVFVGYVANGLEGVYNYERNAQALTIKGGVKDVGGSAMSFDAFGKTYFIKTDPFIGKGKMYGTVTRNQNWKRYVPPRLTNTRTHEVFDAGVEFVVPLLNPGANDIFQGVKQAATAATTDMLEAPFNYPYQIVPDILPGIFAYGIQESIGPTG